MLLLPRIVFAPAWILLLALVTAGIPSRAAAQVPPPPEIRIEAPASMQGFADRLREEFPTFRQEVEQRTGLFGPPDPRVIVAADMDATREALARLTGIDNLPDGVAGLCIKSETTIILNLAAFRDDPRTLAARTFRHEYTHLLLGAFETRDSWPAWFEEGVCQWVERSVYWPDATVAAVRAGTHPLPALEAISRAIDWREGSVVTRGAAYSLAEAAVSQLMARFNDPGRRLARCARLFDQSGDFEASFKAAFGYTIEAFEAELHEDLRPGGWERVVMFVGYHWFELAFGVVPIVLILVALWRRRQARRRLGGSLDPRDALLGGDSDPDALSPAELSRLELDLKRRDRRTRKWDGEMPPTW